ncbi:Xanthine dehydrogenase [Planktothrix sp. PCC 11201]|uniref:XdhC family protein n=1 Tax=Planktothrix sp. PCC 11201 TaxID=1729650 RepID=UPI0009237805|nr:XdhC/CoxI family protein [Planktothrix sp. PCC 11201]SKB11117.1 Xanthine dehydrogenase [Planktothrix sp. PCC 11201]
MNELKAIIKAFDEAENHHQKTALATVVEVQGSAYRQIGAKLLIFADGKRVGSISGGCLENDVCEWAKQVIETGQPQLIIYDTTAPEDIILGLGLGCNGVIKVLIEPLEKHTYRQQIQFIDGCLNARKLGAIATLFQIQENSLIDFKVLVNETGVMINSIEDFQLSEAIIQDTKTALNYQQSQVKTYLWNQTEVPVFIDIIKPAISLIVFGGGEDAIPLVNLAKELGWMVTLIDHRLDAATSGRFPLADQIIIAHPEEIEYNLSRILADFDDYTVAVIMTHNYLCDRTLLKFLLPSSLLYIGLLGSRQRTEQILQELQTELDLNSALLDHFYSPIGLDIGAETPSEIALSILAEIRAVLSHRLGGSLKYRVGSIHQL